MADDTAQIGRQLREVRAWRGLSLRAATELDGLAERVNAARGRTRRARPPGPVSSGAGRGPADQQFTPGEPIPDPSHRRARPGGLRPSGIGCFGRGPFDAGWAPPGTVRGEGRLRGQVRDGGDHTMSEIAELVGCSRATLYRALDDQAATA